MRLRNSTEEVPKRHQQLNDIGTALQELYDAMQPCRHARHVQREGAIYADLGFFTHFDWGLHGSDAAANAGLKADQGAALCDSTPARLGPWWQCAAATVLIPCTGSVSTGRSCRLCGHRQGPVGCGTPNHCSKRTWRKYQS